MNDLSNWPIWLTDYSECLIEARWASTDYSESLSMMSAWLLLITVNVRRWERKVIEIYWLQWTSQQCELRRFSLACSFRSHSLYWLQWIFACHLLITVNLLLIAVNICPLRLADYSERFSNFSRKRPSPFSIRKSSKQKPATDYSEPLSQWARKQRFKVVQINIMAK